MLRNWLKIKQHSCQQIIDDKNLIATTYRYVMTKDMIQCTTKVYLGSFFNYPEYKTDEVISIVRWLECTHFI